VFLVSALIVGLVKGSTLILNTIMKQPESRYNEMDTLAFLHFFTEYYKSLQNNFFTGK